ncbi:hypothetical protein [Streptomyces sp. NRRL B-3648]|uniref:hypothetical protein n=1 Tax=Streptomyces sp. NRRL B-3648 TaxID=1519493 RepID=UPI0006AF0894|nr:hypothetical protein [Streptomyces sp. NRRL B-3648]KOV90252.1 hypothetical protein ADL04_36575 [Streptomyces sp. NRRL B-3648]
MTKDEQKPAWRDVLDRCGLQVVEEAAQGGPSVRSALYAVTGVEVDPVATVPISSPGAAAALDEKWHLHASEISLCDDKGDFLILPPVSGGSGLGWVRVRDTVGTHLPSRIAEVTGSPEFVAVSTDGRRLCAASVEEYDYWVVLHEFS